MLPQRVTRALTRMLKKHHPLWMSLHFTHPAELTPEVTEACARLADAGIPLGSQTVLLKGINDSVDTLKTLYHGLLKRRVRPYYLYQCDPIPARRISARSVEKGLEIIAGLARPHHRLRRADLCDRRARRRRQDSASARLCAGPRRRRPASCGTSRARPIATPTRKARWERIGRQAPKTSDAYRTRLRSARRLSRARLLRGGDRRVRQHRHHRPARWRLARASTARWCASAAARCLPRGLPQASASTSSSPLPKG